MKVTKQHVTFDQTTTSNNAVREAMQRALETDSIISFEQNGVEYDVDPNRLVNFATMEFGMRDELPF